MDAESTTEQGASELVTRARAGDAEAFRALTEPHRRELQVHCYRMLGSLQDAEDALQETLLSAWQGIGGYAGRASVRTWLYKIATNRCLNARRAAGRRPAKAWDVTGFTPPEPTRMGEVPWLEPFPDALLDGAFPVPPGPDARYEQSESVSLAFIAALQMLSPRQVAALVLRDVLGFHAAEAAEMLDSSVESVNGALKRARATLARSRASARDAAAAPAAGSRAEQALVARFVSAFEAADVVAVVALLTEDAFFAMPPIPFEYEGSAEVARFLAAAFGTRRSMSLVPTRANGCPAFGMYTRTADGLRHATGVLVLGLAGGAVCSVMRFEGVVLPWFGLPRTLP
jgi:RNA polymerase sigma-70 factor (ECF subfamily)